jgi:hypothetical protein
VNRRSNTHSFLAAVSAAWADCQHTSRRLVERQMGPARSHRS